MLCNIFLVIILAYMMVITVWSCPSEVCMCKWKNGKQTVECGGRQLTRIPDGMDQGTQVLNFSGNSLTVLQSERFKKMDLINLQKIFLSRNQLMRIHDRAFKGLTNLVELDLSDNMLTVIPTDTFQDYSSLMRLILNGNPIRELKTSAFKHLSFLTTLELSNCQIDRVENEAFIGMDNLEWLRLDGNRIATIKGNHVLPVSLHGVNLQSNRWFCDCHLIDMFTWLNNFNIPQIEDPKCSNPPRLNNRVIKSLQADDLACLPDITPTTLYLEIAEGRNISLLCKIHAIPEASISWWFQGQILQNDTMIAPNVHIFYYIDEVGTIDEKRSELFIYNTNTEDNGTFACVAENSAGRTQANYTIRVIVKEEPIVEQVTFPQEYLLIIIIAGVACIGIVLLIIICLLICKCRKRSKQNKKKKKQRNGKDGVGVGGNNSQKCLTITATTTTNTGDNNDMIICGSKLNGDINLTDRNNHHHSQNLMLYITNNTQNLGINDMNGGGNGGGGGGGGPGQYCSPPSARSYQDQNPDLINDAESGSKIRNLDNLDKELSGKNLMHDNEGGGRSDCGSEKSYSSNYSLQPVAQILHPSQQLHPQQQRFSSLSTLPRGMPRDMYQHQVDIHLNPGCFLDQNGYPVDYNMAKIPVMGHHMAPQVNYYRTLPHKPKNHQLNPIVRYSNDAEFITKTGPGLQAYGNPNDLRFTVEGYPIHTFNPGEHQQFPSPPEGYKSDMMPATYCLASAPSPSMHQQQWPSCLPGYQTVAIKTQPGHEVKRYSSSPQSSALSSPITTPTTVTKKCVGAQTTEQHDNNVIMEQNEDEEEEEDENIVVVSGGGGGGSGGGAGGGGGGSNNHNNEKDSKMRHLTGPLADSPDEGYVGDHDGSDI